jgi:uncharacterized protein
VDAPIQEDFDGPIVDSRLSWYNPPASAVSVASRLEVRTLAGTDFWQRTHYGFRADNGHLLAASAASDFVLETTVHSRPVHQYDQAGLMVRLSTDCWLKTSVEFEPDGANRLGAVVTNGGWSDWSTQDLPSEEAVVSFRIRREGADYTVEVRLPGTDWSQLRIAHLTDDRPDLAVLAGLYCCSPKGAGFVAEFERLQLRPGRLG